MLHGQVGTCLIISTLLRVGCRMFQYTKRNVDIKTTAKGA